MIQPIFRSCSTIFVSCILVSVTFGSLAAEPVVVQGAGIAVTTNDVLGDVSRLAPEARKSMLARPENVTQLGTNIYMRRALAAEAERKGLQTDPVVAAALQVARDRVLSEVYLASVEAAARPSDVALDAQAATSYKANPKQFEVPEQIRARHVLISKGPEARAKAEKLLADLKSGADFAQVAQDNSADPGSASKGGDLGFFPRGRMVPAFETAAFALKAPGDMSDLVETDFGFHIIKLEAQRPAGLLPFEEVRDALRRDIAAKLASATRLQAQNRVMEAARPDKAVIDAFVATQR